MRLKSSQVEPDYAKAIRLRCNDASLNAKFERLLEKDKWRWLSFACKNNPGAAIQFCRELVREREQNSPKGDVAPASRLTTGD